MRCAGSIGSSPDGCRGAARLGFLLAACVGAAGPAAGAETWVEVKTRMASSRRALASA
jgi:hypothetical protein